MDTVIENLLSYDTELVKESRNYLMSLLNSG